MNVRFTQDQVTGIGDNLNNARQVLLWAFRGEIDPETMVHDALKRLDKLAEIIDNGAVEDTHE